MICLTGLILLLFAVAVDGRVGNSTSESSYCTETKECFLFDLVCAGDGYEVRHYDAAKWVTTEVESYFMEIATSRAFRKLYKYITGENEAGAKIDMTAPVLIKVNDSASMWQSAVYGLSFLLPSKYQANPPKPTDPSVYLTDTPDMKVYVKSYGGWMMSLVAKSQADSLKTSLDNVQATYETEYHYNVGYNSPMKIMNRHNEAWFIVKGEPVCPRSG
ncbi:heme-binding protein 2-like [Sinocyclocheilus anshuiensis]|uniref:Heme-binding protein 1 n=1 Tax=Sinocyclocheilus anshuiensis TaxID=1608454 RepID=A0A671QZR7_9TELE|nr:PREDICTED: heme-binding protein 2-like [Sinocyclocheilus anshuiensis]XP_016321154.1 PREDICTED: heme-binding protein 2-like [Sinocyclocheilus anshuiensis]